jgi:nitrogen-specific signal transduction histidine kinase
MLDRSDERFERVPFSLDAERADDSKLTTDDDRVIQVFIEKVRRAIQALER